MKNYIKDYFKKKREEEAAKKKAEFVRQLKWSPQKRKDYAVGKSLAEALLGR